MWSADGLWTTGRGTSEARAACWHRAEPEFRAPWVGLSLCWDTGYVGDVPEGSEPLASEHPHVSCASPCRRWVLGCPALRLQGAAVFGGYR